MCVSSGPRICLLCLLLYGWQAKAVVPNTTGGIPELYDKVEPKQEYSDADEEQKELYFMEKDYFLKKLMTKYGNGVEMNYEGFEHLLHKLGLGGLLEFDHEVSCHKAENSSDFQEMHLHHNHSGNILSSSKVCENKDEHSHEHKDHEHDNHDHIHSHSEHENEHIHEDHVHVEEHDHGHADHKHSKDHDHDHTGDNNQEHTEEHDHKHNEDHHYEHSEENNHEHTEENNHEHSEEHDFEHNSQNETIELDVDHEHDQNHTDEHDEHHHDHDDHHHDHDDHKHDHDDHKHDDHKHEHVEKESIGDTENNPIVNEPTSHNHEHNETADHSHDYNEEMEETEKSVHDHVHEHDHDHVHHVHKRETDHECLAANVMLRMVHVDKPRSLTKDMFKELCPSLIYQIEADSCHSSHRHHDSYHGNHDHDDHDHSTEAESAKIDLSSVPPKVWGFSAVAVIIISLVGLLGVAVIPIMQKVFYNHMLQFLVALAVGALSGDALLHLFPHAIAGGHGDEGGGHGGHDHGSGGHSHDTGPIYKGLCGLLGIYFFFFTERVLTMFTEYKRRKKQTKNRKKYMKDEELVKVGEKLANSECDGMMMSIHPNKALRGYADEAHSEHFTNMVCVQRTMKRRGVDGDENTSMIGSHNSTPKPHGHGHGHKHGHSHGVDGVPDSVASVAWMVILGDGIHNFSDGLAIGAAFVNSITGGFSTSVAVFCHELPHEIGDFAMLLRAGMSPKQAIIYNCLSSILCFIGMLIGVAIGNLEGATLWIFAMVGGMFLYIALVDMLPELSSVETKKGEHPLCHLLLQGIGMCIGAGIMLAIALYEEDLKTILD
ncbi:zinc transporter ZIP10-like [Mercenaria mercenaria]|uniref:zinc transporter ZIP10-like n=1 Tax=Mercenaria mercenaria TaxID=6596 RepID=UPI00234F24A4|nr:zinc transporter ZIP10-like [Mercenaria mercenaria]